MTETTLPTPSPAVPVRTSTVGEGTATITYDVRGEYGVRLREVLDA